MPHEHTDILGGTPGGRDGARQSYFSVRPSTVIVWHGRCCYTLYRAKGGYQDVECGFDRNCRTCCFTHSTGLVAEPEITLVKNKTKWSLFGKRYSYVERYDPIGIRKRALRRASHNVTRYHIIHIYCSM